MHRSRFEITASILELCKNIPQRQDWVLHYCNIHSSPFKSIAQKLISAGMLDEVPLKRHRKPRKRKCVGYLTTDKGQEWLEKYYALIAVLNAAETKVK